MVRTFPFLVEASIRPPSSCFRSMSCLLIFSTPASKSTQSHVSPIASDSRRPVKKNDHQHDSKGIFFCHFQKSFHMRIAQRAQFLTLNSRKRNFVSRIAAEIFNTHSRRKCFCKNTVNIVDGFSRHRCTFIQRLSAFSLNLPILISFDNGLSFYQQVIVKVLNHVRS